MNKTQHHIEICTRLTDTYVRKNSDYGSSFDKTYDRFGPRSVAIRLSDKLERFCNLVDSPSDGKVKDETIKDTLYDLANYAIMAIIRLEEAETVSDENQ